MKSKLKSNLIIMEIVFLLIVVGGSVLVYSTFAASFYTKAKIRVIKEAYEDLQEIDMSELDGEEFQKLESYEEEHISFVIADGEFRPIYTTTNIDQEGIVRRNIQIVQDKFSENPEVRVRTTRNFDGIRLRGIFYQAGKKYYAYIRETTSDSYGAFYYTEKFLLAVVVLTLVMGSFVMYYLGRRIAKPIETMAVVSKKLAAHDFSARVKEDTHFEEVNELAKSFNTMAEQLQYYVQKLEKNNSELEWSNERLQEQNFQKEQMERMRQEFNANISHELKTPLAVISSQVEMLQFVEGEVDKQFYFESIQEEIDKMAGMIGTLLKISAAEHELEELDCQPLNLVDAIEYLMLKYDALFRQKEIKRTCSMEQDCVVIADRSCIEKAMSNYIQNALGHTSAGCRINISLEREADKVIFRVFNEGTPIQEKDFDKIWNSYYQGQDTENHAGLGLYIVKTVVTLHKGQYGVKNQGKGVEFWFSLPVCEEAGRMDEGTATKMQSVFWKKTE